MMSLVFLVDCYCVYCVSDPTLTDASFGPCGSKLAQSTILHTLTIVYFVCLLTKSNTG